MAGDDTGRRTAWLAGAAGVAVVAGVAAFVGGLAADGGDGGDRGDGGASGGRVAATDRSTVAVALRHLDVRPDRLVSFSTGDDQFGAGTVGGVIGEGDDLRLQVSVSPGDEGEDCERFDGCDRSETDQGRLTIAWQEVEPEEDPGIVYVVLQRGDEVVRVEQSGVLIEGDPREQELPVTVEEMVAIASDPDLALRTTQAAVDEGEALDGWEQLGEESQTEELDYPDSAGGVQVDDRGVAAQYVAIRGEIDTIVQASPSPLAREYGVGAVGAELRVEKGESGPAYVLDVVGTPDMRQTDLLVSLCAENTRCAEADGRYLLWEPGRAGHVTVAHVRDAEIIVLRVRGLDVPEDQAEVEMLAGVQLQTATATQLSLYRPDDPSWVAEIWQP